MASATVNIYDNDQDTALVTVTASGQPKEFGGGVPGTFTFTRRYIPSSSKLSLPLTIRYDITVDAGHATNGSDYVTLTGQLTIPANQLSQTVELMPIDDAEVESTELVTITIHDEIPSYLGESSQSATLTILDNDPAKVWLEAVQDASEPDQKGKFKLWRDGGDISQPLSVNFTVDGSATLNTDYTGLAPTMVIPANVRVMYVDIAPIADDLEEGVEIIRATLGTSSAYTPQSPLQQSIRLYDKYSKTEERTTVSVVANDPTASEFGFSDGSYQFTRDGDLSKDLTVYFTLSGSADEEADFHPLSRAITFYPNQRQVTINLYPTIDNEVEGPETVIVSLAGGDGYTISKGSVTVTITDDPPVVSIVALQDAVEGGNVGKFVLYRTGGDLTQELGVFFTPAGTASQSEDYASTSSYHTFVADAWQTTLEIQPYKDNRVEGEETIRIAIDTNSSYLIEPLTAEAEITLHDTPAYVWISSGAAASEPATKGHFTVGRFGGDIDETLPVRITIGGTAKAGADYEAIYERVEIPAGKSTVDVDIVPLKDNDVEGTETVQITVLADPQTFFLLNDNVTVNLYDDPPTVNVEVVDNASEPASPGKFRFTRSGGDLSVPLTATFSLSGTATTGDDYETVTTSVSFAEGITFAYVYLNPRADNLIEGMEYAIAKVQPTSKYVAGWNGEAWLGINDDPPRVSIYHEADASEPDREGAFTLVREGGDLSQSMAVQLQVVGGTAVLGTDYENISSQVFIPAGVGAYSVRIKPIDDTEAEDDETIQVAIVANPTAYVIQNGWAQTLLHDDDQTRFVLTLDKGTINEGQSVTLTGTFDIDQNDWGPHLVTIDWADDSKADTIFLEPGDDEFELAHKYEDDGKLKRDANDRPIAGNNTPQDPHAILAKLQGFFTPVVNRSKTVTVKNVVPVKVVLQIDSPIPGPDGVIEIEGGTKVPDGNGGFRAEGGEGLILRGNVTDAGGQEWYDLAVDWGDGTGRKHQQQESPPQYRNGLTWASSIHGPSLAGEEIAPGAAAITRDIWVEIKANDDDQPDQTVSDKKKVRIRSLPPALMFDVYDKTPDGKLSLLNGPTPTHGFEGKPNQQGGTVYIEGAIVRSPSGKWNQVKWNWGDGSPEVTLPTVFDVATGAFKFTATHQYADNKPWNGVAYGQYDLKAKAYSTKYTETVLNKDDAVEIANVLPSKLKATFKEDEQDKNAVEIRGTFDDPGPKDPHTVEVKWDTLSNEPPIIISLPPGLTSFDPASQVFKDYEMNPEYAQYAGQLPQLKVDIESKLKHVYGELTGAGVTISVEVYDNDIVRVTNAKGKALFGQSAANGEILAK